jgi:dihydropyrimidinase
VAGELIVRGGTVVTPGGRVQADVVVAAGRIVQVGEVRGSVDAREVDAHGMLVLPGMVDVHTHTRVATDAQPDRFFRDSVAAAFGGTTTFLTFNNPGTGSAQTGSLPTDVSAWQHQTDSDSAVDYGLSLVLQPTHDDLGREIPAAIDTGVPTFKAFMVYDFALPDSQLRLALRATAEHAGLLNVHCEDRAALEANTARLLADGRTAPRYHAESRPPAVEAAGTRKALQMAHDAGAPLYIVHLSCAAALEELRAAHAAAQQAFAETCPQYLVLDESRYALPDEEAVRYLISPPLRPRDNSDALWIGLADGSLSNVASDHVPDRLAVDKADWRQPFDRISNGGPGIETLLPLVYSRGVAPGRLTLERMVDLLSTAPARLFGLNSKGSIEVGKDADLVIFDPTERRTLYATDLHHSSDYTPYEGMELAGRVHSVLVRGEFVIRDGHFVGRRGYGQFQERELRWRSGAVGQ